MEYGVITSISVVWESQFLIQSAAAFVCNNHTQHDGNYTIKIMLSVLDSVIVAVCFVSKITITETIVISDLKL